MTDIKKCSRCGSTENVYTTGWCRECARIYANEWRAKNRERYNRTVREWDRRTGHRASKKRVANGKQKEYWRENREQLTASKRARYYGNKEEILKAQRAYVTSEQGRATKARWKEANREKLLACKRASYARNKEAHKKRMAIWTSLNREKILEKHRAYSKSEHGKKIHAEWRERNRDKVLAGKRNDFIKHREKYRVSAANNKARRKGAFGYVSQEEWEFLVDQFSKHCLCCWEIVKLSVDHVIPIVKGGSNTIANIQPLCKHCNMVKGIQTIDYRPAAVLKLAAAAIAADRAA